MKFRYARLIFCLFFLLFVGNISESYAANLSTGYYPVSTIESIVPSTGWSGSPDNIKVNDNTPFTNTFISGGNVSYINTHIEFPTLPSNAVIPVSNKFATLYR